MTLLRHPFAVFLIVAALCLGGTVVYRGMGDSTPPSETLDRVHLPDLIVDLYGADRVHAKLAMSLVIPAGDAALSEDQRGAVMDLYTIFLRTLTPEDLSGSAATARLKSELIRRADLAIGRPVVRDVLFRTLLIQ